MIGGLQGENADLNNKYLKKNLKESVTNIWEHTSGFRSLQHDLRKFRKLKVSISQLAKLSFSLVRLSSNGHNFFISALICLKSWTPDFPSFKRHIICIKWTPRSARNVSYSCCPLAFLHVRFLSLFFLLAFLICFWKRTTKLQSLYSSYKWAFICFAMDYT